MSYNSLSKKTLEKVFWRHYCHGASCWNFENQDGPNSAFVYYPALKEIYGDDEEGLKKRMHSHYTIYNTNFIFGSPVINGVVLALEENKDEPSTAEAVRTFKASLMGPMAGIGDSLMTMFSNMFSVYAAQLAEAGNAFAVVLGFIWAGILFAVERVLFFKSYVGGRSFVQSLSTKMTSIIKCASVLGLMVVGAMIASNISVYCGLTYTMGETVYKVSSVLDNILPKMVPVLAVSFGYWLLGRKGMTTSKMILIFLAIAIVFANLGILAR